MVRQKALSSELPNRVSVLSIPASRESRTVGDGLCARGHVALPCSRNPAEHLENHSKGSVDASPLFQTALPFKRCSLSSFTSSSRQNPKNTIQSSLHHGRVQCLGPAFFESKPLGRFDRVWEVIHSTNVVIKESTASLSPTCWSQARYCTVAAYDKVYQKENATDWKELHNLLWLTDGDR